MPRDLRVPGRELAGIHFAMEFLTAAEPRLRRRSPSSAISARDKHVIIIGGGDTGADCLGTAHRQGARSVRQLELLQRPPDSARRRTPGRPGRTSSACRRRTKKAASATTRSRPSASPGTADGRVARLHATAGRDEGRPSSSTPTSSCSRWASSGPSATACIDAIWAWRSPRAAPWRAMPTWMTNVPRRLRRRRHAARPVADCLGHRRRPELRPRRRRLPHGQLVAACARGLAQHADGDVARPGLKRRARSCRRRRRAARAARAALQRFSDCVDDLLAASVRRRPGTPPAPASSSRSAATAAGSSACSRTSTSCSCSTARSDPRKKGACARSCIRCGTCASRSATRSGRWTTSPSSKSTTPNSCWRCSTRRAVAGDASLLDRIAARVPYAGRARADPRRAEAPDRRAARTLQRHALPARTRRQGRARRASRSVGRAHDCRRSPIRRCSIAARPIAARLDDAEEFLLRLRSILHVEHKRNNNVLSHETPGAGGAADGLRRRSRASRSSG